MSELLINKIPTDENMVTIDDDLILDKKHFLSVNLRLIMSFFTRSSQILLASSSFFGNVAFSRSISI